MPARCEGVLQVGFGPTMPPVLALAVDLAAERSKAPQRRRERTWRASS
jgi:hypothetical protein